MVVMAIVRPVWFGRVVCAGVVQFPTEPVTSEAHPYPHRLWFGIPCEASARSREADSDQVRYQFNGLGRGVPQQLVSERSPC
ncbi:hypothetical protein Taro_051745 [Colocasia esculenta]|uniref:Secreted protein n=1 Tax=Colocasia esculenta TaxID=4460 RepID=A0A843XHS4_COLES|nr:hypothetical protein [Colocasia esculenta]